ncbi:hypothetical protein ACCUM_4029 [Candidatus Accumulibacter phosphatis]|uniref:Uncharacterized protein n=1 Tax=Candidatus Accumulibacter phosphatis TaxID=327160 RepID=A0A5S4EMT1_9PROT|nr:hypothetical protein ACCUM_4029 [Candidatus Accumulibacter phosphatis]
MAEMVVHSAPGVATRSPFQEAGQIFQSTRRLPASSRLCP